jgi:hypothetical protein
MENALREAYQDDLDICIHLADYGIRDRMKGYGKLLKFKKQD